MHVQESSITKYIKVPRRGEEDGTKRTKKWCDLKPTSFHKERATNLPTCPKNHPPSKQTHPAHPHMPCNVLHRQCEDTSH